MSLDLEPLPLPLSLTPIVLSCLVLSCLVLSCLVLSCLVLSCRLVSSRLVSSRFVSSRHILSCVCILALPSRVQSVFRFVFSLALRLGDRQSQDKQIDR